jgi:DNA-binding NarL/FixJ family response regulator
VLDHVLLRQGLRRLLEDEPDLEVVCEAGNATEALDGVFEHRPEVVIADAEALGLGAEDAEQLILRVSPHSRILFVSLHEGEDLEAHNAGKLGTRCAVRYTSGEELAEMIRSAYRSRGSNLRQASRAGRGARPAAGDLLLRKRVLTAREREVLKLLAEGKTVRSAAGLLGLSIKTVDAHKFNLMRKLGLHNKAELVMWAIQQRVVKIPANF